MKKSIAKKFAVLGTIGAMTLAGASSVFAADGGKADNSSTFMSESEAKSRIAAAEEQGVVVERGDNTELITIGDYTYTYSFEKTEEKEIKLTSFSNISQAMDALDAYAKDPELSLHDTGFVIATIEYYSILHGIHSEESFQILGTQYLGYLNISCVEVESINMSMDSETIQPDIPTAITYSVNDYANMDGVDIKFESSDDTVASVVKFDGKAYVTGHKEGSVTITAIATRADGTVFKCYQNVDVLQQ